MNIEILVGQVLSEIDSSVGGVVLFKTADGKTYKMHHNQDCCESVYLEDVAGEWDDLIGYPITLAEEVTSNENPTDATEDILEYQDSFTWTFYKLATIKGYVDLRWYGESNGYYSESVDFEEVVK